MTFGYPISETQRLGLSVGLTDTEITSGRYAVQEIRTSPRLDPAIEQYYVSTLQPDGTCTRVRGAAAYQRACPPVLSPRLRAMAFWTSMVTRLPT